MSSQIISRMKAGPESDYLLEISFDLFKNKKKYDKSILKN